MPILLKSLSGSTFPLNVSTKVNEKVSEDGILEFEIIENEYTYDVVTSITKMWTVTYVAGSNDIREYRIVMLDKSSIGEKQQVYVKARQREIDDLNCKRIYEAYTGSFTGQRYFDLVFKNTGYKYKLTTKVNASRFENLGVGDTNLEIFKKGLERYGLEYEYDESIKTFILKPSVENKAKYFIDSRVNANNIKIEEDATKCYTYIRGYGDFDENLSYNEAGLIIEFTHPLSHVIGKRDAPPVIDGRITKEESMKARLESEINQSLTSSLSLDFITIPQFKNAVPKPGDIVRVTDELSGVDDDVRIVEVTTERDPYNKIIKQDVVLGDFRLRERYMKRINQTANYVGGMGGLNTSNPTKAGRITQASVNASLSSINKLAGEIEKIQNNTANVKDIANMVVTKDGTLIYDYTNKSNIKNINKIGIIGDSIAKGTNTSKNFGKRLGDKIEAEVTNAALSGSTMSTNKVDGVYEQATKMKDMELIIIQGSDTDWILNGGIEIGNDPNNTKEYYGAFCQSIKTLKENNMAVKIVCMTPTRQLVLNGTNITRKDTDKNKLGYTLESYVNAQILACTQLNIPVYDAFHDSYINPYNPAFRKKCMQDGLHPNDLAHEVIMYELIKNYYYFYG